MDHLRNQFEPRITCEFVYAIDCGFEAHAAVARLQNDAIIVTSLDAQTGPQRKRKIDGRGAGVEQVKRPDINGAAG